MPLLELHQVCRAYPGGDGPLLALDGIDLTIKSGESIAIVGASGSGKSTLMNILGCLDRPTSGSYCIGGQDTATLNPDHLADLRRECFGFIFQRYHLLPDLTALSNVEVPAIYARLPRAARHARAAALLNRLGLQDRLEHRPNQLSGGQQQRTSIARALMNGGRIILADEPTGALDSHSGEEVLELLQELHAEGHTLILVTHDSRVAAHANRVVEMRDGRIEGDRRMQAPPGRKTPECPLAVTEQGIAARNSLRSIGDDLLEATRMALLAMRAHRMRTALTMLGIIIGIASLVLVVALGAGGKAKVIESMHSLGTNTLDIMAGRDFGDEHAERVTTLTAQDAEAIRAQPFVDSVTPSLMTQQSVRFGSISVSAQVSGVGEQYFRVRDTEMKAGASFDATDRRALAQVAVIDDNMRKRLFGPRSAIGEVILIGTMPCRIMGVTAVSQAEAASPALHVYLPYTTAISRLLGARSLSTITVRIADQAPNLSAQSAIETLLKRRHGAHDFYLYNSDVVRKSVEDSVQTFTILIASIALISLIVGGIGVMNIMLVSVTERTREIGVRAAVGARRADILRQFLIEAVLVCLLGGAFGIVAALAGGLIFNEFVRQFPLIFSSASMLIAVGASTLIGVIFGYLPARNAANLSPIEALARE